MTDRPLQDITTVELVGYDYFAQELGVQLRTLYAYASEKNAQRLDDFPKPVTPKGHRQPLFTKADADAFLERRRAGSPTGKGRVRPAALSSDQRAAAIEATAILGREIDLENRNQLRQAIYDDLSLPVVRTTKESGLPSITTMTLKKLYKQTGHPFLQQLLIYRGIPAQPAND